MVLYVANWPETRILAWETLTRARAIENQAYVFALNRIGTDGNQFNYVESSHCFFLLMEQMFLPKRMICFGRIRFK